MEKLFSFTKKDFDLDWFSGTGAGGQHRNKHKNCCRIRHKQTGITTTGQDHKSRRQNQKDAFDKMVKLLVDHYVTEEDDRRGVEPEHATRTYNECENRVVDHETGEKFSFRQTIGCGDMSKLIESRLKKTRRK